MEKSTDEQFEVVDLKELQQRADTMPGVIAVLGQLRSGTIITEEGVAYLFKRHVTSVKRAVQRGELPPPCRLFGTNTWTVGTLISHIEKRLQQAQKEAENTARRLARYSS